MRNKLIFVSLILTTAFCVTSNAQKAPPTYEEVQQFIKETKVSTAQKQQQANEASAKTEAVIARSKANQKTNMKALEQNEQDMQALASTSSKPAQPEETSGPVPTCATNCDDTSNAYNYKGNFLFDAQGKKIQRIYPSPCKCPQTSNSTTTMQTPSTTTPTTKQKNNWNIQY